MMFDFNAFADLIARKVAALLSRSLADDVLDTEGAAKLLKLHPVTVAGLAASGDLPARKVGREWRYRRSALLDHITSNAHQRGPESLPLAGD